MKDVLVSDVYALINRCFANVSYNGYQHVENFPHVFSPANSSFLCVEALEGSIGLQGACTVYPTSWYLPSGLGFQGACVGNVCVDVPFRNQGIGQKLLQYAEEKAQQWGCCFVYLFSDLSEFYEKAGYRPYGAENFVQLNPDFLVQFWKILKNEGLKNHKDSWDVQAFVTKEGRMSPFLNVLWSFIIQYSSHCFCLLSFQDFIKMMQIPDMEVFMIFNNRENYKDIDIQACCFLGKGSDFQNVIHGFYFKKPEVCLILLDFIVKNRVPKDQGQFIIMTSQLTAFFKAQNCSLFTTYKMFIKILDGHGKFDEPRFCKDVLDKHEHDLDVHSFQSS